MRILQISPTVFHESSVIGGGERYIEYLDQALKAGAHSLGIQIQTASFQQLRNTSIPNAQTKREDLSGRDPWAPNSYDPIEVLEVFKNWDVVIVHQSLTNFGLFMASLARLSGLTVIGIDHGGGKSRILDSSPESITNYDFLIAQSEFAKKTLAGLDVDIEVILGPIPQPRLFKISADTDSLDPYFPQAISIGRVLPHKGFETVINALPIDMSYKVFGKIYDRDYAHHLTRLAKRAGKAFEIFENMSDEDLARETMKSHVYIQPSSYFDYRGNFYSKPELLGLAPLEAISSGIKTLVSNAGALPELVKFKNCEVYTSFEHLRGLLQKSDFSRVPASEAIDSVQGEYGIKQFGTRVLELIGSRS
jgi:glycosyltransferase involved in cell wall biosynthesis